MKFHVQSYEVHTSTEIYCEKEQTKDPIISIQCSTTYLIFLLAFDH